ncbi:hypothetical protein [Sporosarcina ureilytica]|uniref:DUF4352 domain-containing protein n=1 Tax=Sporosarcina ureilytica TaxID=298596 RepID=A0A1D8JK63_9BACL|nr:hypothetical protein [Sporosarcina ureilytica]AOV09108.1 hypothetical protein BI350_05660 [Sporosarcina ureilytica]
MKKRLYVLGVVSLLLLTACGDIDAKNDREVMSNENSTSEEQESEIKEEVEKEEKEKAVGTRSNPLPFGDTITVKERIYDDSFNGYDASLEITLLETIRGEEAWAIIQKENQFNESAEDGFEYVLIKVKGFLKDADTDDDSLFFSSFDFDFVSDDGEVYGMTSAVIPDELQKELYNGGTGEGYIYGQVKVGDDFKVSYDSSEGSPVFFFVE